MISAHDVANRFKIKIEEANWLLVTLNKLYPALFEQTLTLRLKNEAMTEAVKYVLEQLINYFDYQVIDAGGRKRFLRDFLSFKDELEYEIASVQTKSFEKFLERKLSQRQTITDPEFDTAVFDSFDWLKIYDLIFLSFVDQILSEVEKKISFVELEFEKKEE